MLYIHSPTFITRQLLGRLFKRSLRSIMNWFVQQTAFLSACLFSRRLPEDTFLFFFVVSSRMTADRINAMLMAVSMILSMRYCQFHKRP